MAELDFPGGLPRAITPPDEPLNDVLHAAGYTAAVEWGKARFYRGMVELAGGLAHMGFLRSQALLNLFSDANARTGAAYTLGELFGVMKVGKSAARSAAVEHLYGLSDKRILMRGYVVPCPVCKLDNWISVSKINERVACSGCLAAFQMPLQVHFSYKLNQVYLEGLVQGALTVLLTAMHLYDGGAPFTWQACTVAEKGGGRTEIDLLCKRGDALVVVECKDNFNAGSDAAAFEEQVRRAKQVSREIGAEFAFATLQPAASIPAAVQSVIDAVGASVLDRDVLLHGGVKTLPYE